MMKADVGKIVPFRTTYRRRESAVAEGLRLDGIWFCANPDRFWHSRPAIAGEFDGCEGKAGDISLVYRNEIEGFVDSISMQTKIDLPDNDAFLGGLWFMIQIKRKQGEPFELTLTLFLLLLHNSIAASGEP